MALFYKLEYLTDESENADDAVYIHYRFNPPFYLAHIDKEEYDILPDEEKHEFATVLFNIQGVVELSLKAYRIWLMKSPIYTWQEVIDPVLAYITFYHGEDEAIAIQGSADVNGKGSRLKKVNERRDI